MHIEDPMEHTSIAIRNEIGKLQTVLVHAPGAETVNYDFIDLERVYGRASFCLERARAEHQEFVSILQEFGVEVLFLEDLVAQSIASNETREAFIDIFLKESGLRGSELISAAKERLASIEDSRELVITSMQGLYVRDVTIPQEQQGLCAGLNMASDENMLLVDPMTDLFFTRDPVTIFDSSIRFNRLLWKQRNRELVYYETLFRNHPRFADAAIINEHDSAYFTEGGDTLMLTPTRILIGVGPRTHAAAADSIARAFLSKASSSDSEQRAAYVLRFSTDASSVHLDCHVTQVDEETFICSQDIVEQSEGYKISRNCRTKDYCIEKIDGGIAELLARALGKAAVRIVVCRRDGGGKNETEYGGASVLCLKPGTVCSFEQNHEVNDELSAAGFNVVSFPSTELTTSFGGPHCICLPLGRADI